MANIFDLITFIYQSIIIIKSILKNLILSNIWYSNFFIFIQIFI